MSCRNPGADLEIQLNPAGGRLPVHGHCVAVPAQPQVALAREDVEDSDGIDIVPGIANVLGRLMGLPDFSRARMQRPAPIEIESHIVRKGDKA